MLLMAALAGGDCNQHAGALHRLGHCDRKAICTAQGMLTQVLGRAPRHQSLPDRRAGLSFGQLLAPNLMLLFMPVPHTSLFTWLTGLSRNQLIRYHRCVMEGPWEMGLGLQVQRDQAASPDTSGCVHCVWATQLPLQLLGTCRLSSALSAGLPPAAGWATARCGSSPPMPCCTTCTGQPARPPAGEGELLGRPTHLPH